MRLEENQSVKKQNLSTSYLISRSEMVSPLKPVQTVDRLDVCKYMQNMQRGSQGLLFVPRSQGWGHSAGVEARLPASIQQM